MKPKNIGYSHTDRFLLVRPHTNTHQCDGCFLKKQKEAQAVVHAAVAWLQEQEEAQAAIEGRELCTSRHCAECGVNGT